MLAATTEPEPRQSALDIRIAQLLASAQKLGQSDERVLEALLHVLCGVEADRNVDDLLDEVRARYGTTQR